jgi:ribosomal protein S26
MAKARNMYQCNRCSRYMPSQDRVKVKTEYLSPVHLKTVEDYCTSCVTKTLKGKEVRELPSRNKAA